MKEPARDPSVDALDDASSAPEADGAQSRGFKGTVHALSRMIKSLESQLDQMLAINAALEQDVDDERKMRQDEQRARRELEDRLRRTEQESASKEDSFAELRHLRSERARVAATADELRRKLTDAEEQQRAQARAVEKMRAQRADALEELQSVEEQFERAMEMVTDLKTRLAVMSEEYDALRGRVRSTENKMRVAEQERDALLAEVDDSRTALEDIRRSLVDACVSAQGRRTDDIDG